MKQHSKQSHPALKHVDCMIHHDTTCRLAKCLVNSLCEALSLWRPTNCLPSSLLHRRPRWPFWIRLDSSRSCCSCRRTHGTDAGHEIDKRIWRVSIRQKNIEKPSKLEIQHTGRHPWFHRQPGCALYTQYVQICAAHLQRCDRLETLMLASTTSACIWLRPTKGLRSRLPDFVHHHGCTMLHISAGFTCTGGLHGLKFKE